MDRIQRRLFQDIAEQQHVIVHATYDGEETGEINAEETLFLALSSAELALISLGLYTSMIEFPCLHEETAAFLDRITELQLAQGQMTQEEFEEYEEAAKESVRDYLGYDPDDDEDEAEDDVAL